MRYVDGFLLVVPKKKLKLYKKMAKEGGRLWKRHGALEYIEAVADDMTTGAEWGVRAFPKTAGAKPGEVVVFSFIVYKSRKHRDAVNKKVMADPSMNDPKNKNKPMPFDMKRMSYGGFKTVVDM